MENKKIYQIQIALKNFSPKIWRRVLVPADMPLGDLHQVIQAAMGWYDSHLHQFRKGRNEYVPQPPEYAPWGGQLEGINYSGLAISDLLKKEKDKIIYEYDFGDGWEHDIILEKILTRDDKLTYPVCVAGKNACPPEDCGGVWGYADLLEIITDPKNEQYEDMKEWVGEDFDPKYFNKDEVNELFRR